MAHVPSVGSRGRVTNALEASLIQNATVGFYPQVILSFGEHMSGKNAQQAVRDILALADIRVNGRMILEKNAYRDNS